MATIDVGTTIAERIAAREGVDPVELAVPLYEVVETDALEALVNRTDGRQSQNDLSVGFSYLGYAVTVHGSGGVTIDTRPEDA